MKAVDPLAGPMVVFDDLLDAYEREVESALDPDIPAYQALERELRDRRRNMVAALRVHLRERNGRRDR
jgi:hypothetical protein